MKWISVKDKLPEEDSKMLWIWIVNNNHDETHLNPKAFPDTDSFYEGVFSYWSAQSDHEITHWMVIDSPLWSSQ